MRPFQALRMRTPSAPAIPGVTYDPDWDKVILLLGFPGANNSTTFNDESLYARSGTAVGDAKVVTAQSKFGGTSLLLDGTGDYVTFPDSADWTLGSGDFTIETFVRFNATGNMQFIGQANAATGWQFMTESNSLRFNNYGPSSTQIYETASGWPISTGVWYHCVAERAGTTYRLYRDGSMVLKVTSVTGSISDSTDLMKIGTGFTGSFNGWMDEVRITKGLARYNSDGGYTVPSSAYPRGGLPIFSVQPSISGNTWVGEVLTRSLGTDDGTSRTTQWKADGTPISGETGATYTIVSGDVGKVITCSVTATNANGSTTATSAGTATITLTAPTSYANAGGTGNRTASITVSATNIAAGASTPSKMVDGSLANDYWWTGATGNGTGWILFDFGSGVTKQIDEFKLYQDASVSHGAWRLEGSNDNSSWTQCGSDFTLSGGTSPTPIAATNSTAYRYYRLRHMSGSRSSSPYIREIEFKIL